MVKEWNVGSKGMREDKFKIIRNWWENWSVNVWYSIKVVFVGYFGYFLVKFNFEGFLIK